MCFVQFLFRSNYVTSFKFNNIFMYFTFKSHISDNSINIDYLLVRERNLESDPRLVVSGNNIRKK